MAQVQISVGGIDIAIEDEDRDFKPLLKAARRSFTSILEQVGPKVLDEDDEDEDE